MIEGVFLKELATHADERGFFREIIRADDGFFRQGFGQLSHSLVNQGVLKAWHLHKVQTQWNYVVSGLLKVALYDTRPGSPTFREIMEFQTGDGQAPRVYSFPPGVAHGYRCITGPVHIFYVTSGTYDPAGDEVRLSPDDQELGYDWRTGHRT